MAKIGAIIGVYQEADYLPYAIKQAEQFCDEIIIFEGCHSVNHPTRSTDGTVEIVEQSGHEHYMLDNNSGQRYDSFQCDIWTMGVAEMMARGCDWFRFWDCDTYFFDKDLSKVKETMETTSKDCLTWCERRFLFNWRLNTREVSGRFYRVTDGMFLKPISRVHHKDGSFYNDNTQQLPITPYHFTQAKKLARAEFRFQLSKEKGTPGIDELWEKYKNFKLPPAEAWWEHDKEVCELVGGYGPTYLPLEHQYPEVLDGHPYRFVNDIRTVE